MLPIIIYCRHSSDELLIGTIREFGTILQVSVLKTDYMMMAGLIDDIKMLLLNQ